MSCEACEVDSEAPLFASSTRRENDSLRLAVNRDELEGCSGDGSPDGCI